MNQQLASLNTTVKKRMTIEDVLEPRESTQVRRAIEHNPFRRLAESEECSVPTEKLCQSMHIDKFQGAARPILGGDKSQYYLHSIDSARREISRLLDAGISAVYLQLQPEHTGMASEAVVGQFSEMVSAIRSSFGKELFIAADPQGLCMGRDLRWGVRSEKGEIDPEGTLSLLAEGSFSLAQAGIDALVTIGRANCEAAVARAALNKHSDSIELWGFSTNSETPNAYFDITAGDISKANTKQKILVGNNLEMILRSLQDIVEGVDVVVQKPAENLQVLYCLRSLIEGKMAVESILGEERIQKMMADNPYLFEDGKIDLTVLESKLSKTRLGTYEVSGTYSIYKHLEDRYSAELALAMLEEMYRNALFAGGNYTRFLTGRNMLWFAETRKQIGL